MHDELDGQGLTCIAVALDESAEALAQFVTAIDTMPVLLDRDHVLAELLAISNVPTVIWIDERDRIVRPNANEFGSDTFFEFTGVRSEVHKDLVRAWVHHGEVPISADVARQAVGDLTDDEVRARLHFRAAVHLRRAGRAEAAERHFDAAIALAPLDFTISRAAMPLRGQNPFGEEFFVLYDQWKAAGEPFHGISRRGA